MDSVKNILKGLWAKYLSLKRWQQIVVAILLVGIIGGPFSNDESAVKGDSKTTLSASPTPTPEAESPTPTPTATVSEKPQPDSPLEFRLSAIRDLDDLAKDISDARTALKEEGLGSFNWNVFEIGFNITQLEMRVPAENIADDWNNRIAQLRSSYEDLSGNLDSLTLSSARSKLSKIENGISPLRRIAKTIGN